MNDRKRRGRTEEDEDIEDNEEGEGDAVDAGAWGRRIVSVKGSVRPPRVTPLGMNITAKISILNLPARRRLAASLLGRRLCVHSTYTVFTFCSVARGGRGAALRAFSCTEATTRELLLFLVHATFLHGFSYAGCVPLGSPKSPIRCAPSGPWIGRSRQTRLYQPGP